MWVIAQIIPFIAIAIILIAIVIMIIKAKNFKRTIKDTVDLKKSIEETITAKAKEQLQNAMKGNETLTCEYCGTACNKGDKKCSSCGSTLKSK